MNDLGIRKFRCKFVQCTYESASFNKVLSHIWDKHGLSPNFSFKCEISCCTRAYSNLQSYRRHVKAKHTWFFEQHMKYFNPQQAVRQEQNLEHHTFQEFNQLYIDQSSFDDSNEVGDGADHLDLVAGFLLELRNTM